MRRWGRTGPVPRSGGTISGVRRLITGVDANGRSCVVEASAFDFEQLAAGFGADRFFTTGDSPPPARPPGHGDALDAGVAPGCVTWTMYECQPGSEYPTHTTDTIDFDMVVSGTVDLILDDGVHTLGPGDCVVVTGVDHAWRSGPDGYSISVVMLGTPHRG